MESMCDLRALLGIFEIRDTDLGIKVMGYNWDIWEEH